MGDGNNTSTNAFLRNLSQKKYAWMQPSASPAPQSLSSTNAAPAAGSTATTSTSTTTAPSTTSTSNAATLTSPSTTTSTATASSKLNNARDSTTLDSKRASDDQTRSSNKKPRHSIKRSSNTSTLSVEDDMRHALSPKRLTVTASSSSPATKQQQLSPSRTPSPTPTLPGAAGDDNNDDERVKRSLPRFKYTSFPVKGFSILPTRNITSSFDKTDSTYFRGNKAGEPSIAPDAEEEWRDTIVIHPGSRNLRIGRASEAFPRTVPHVIARRMNHKNQQPTTKIMGGDGEMNVDDDDDNDEEGLPAGALETLKNELKWRMKAAKRRAVPNAESQVLGFNTQAYQETIPDHNDPYKVEWTEVTKDSSSDYFVGDKALNLPTDQHQDYQLCYPWKYGSLNNQDYDSIEAVLGDLQTIWTDVIHTELEVEEKTFENYNAVLVIPDVFCRRYTCELLTMLLRHMKFRGALVQQESSCATFGAGVSSACVVDIGAQKTSVACIEDGVCLTDSRITISMGGDDITKTFASFLFANQFPYSEVDLNKAYGWRLMEELKEKWCTMNEADISVQVYDFFVRMPRQPTKKYQCKVYDEVFLAPLCLVYPAILNAKEKTERSKVWASTNVLDDITDETSTPQTTIPTIWKQQPEPILDVTQQSTPNNATTTANGSTPPERSNMYDVYPIDVAVAKSIQTAAGASDERLKRFFTNIILVGGGGMISNFDRVLEDRILSTVVAQQARIERVEVLPAPRELDPRLLMWKGAAVLSKLDTAKEMWIGEEEWDEVGARVLRERALFL